MENLFFIYKIENNKLSKLFFHNNYNMDTCCFVCNKKINTKIYMGFDKHFCSNTCRKTVYYINNSIDPAFNNPSCWINKKEDISYLFKNIKKKELSISNTINTIKEENNTIKEENNTIKEDTNTIKEDTNTIKEDTNTIKEENNTIKEENNTIKEDTNTILFSDNFFGKEYISICNIIYDFPINKLLTSLYIL